MNNINRPLIKICGISEPEHAKIAVQAGADLIGLVFYAGSHRNVTLEQAMQVAAAVRRYDESGKVKVVGLFVNEAVASMNDVAERVGLDLIQLSGNERPSSIQDLARPAIATIRADAEDGDSAHRRAREWSSVMPRIWALLVDAHVPGRFGGTGITGDWNLAADLAREYPLILAGGLDPENVEAALNQVRPRGVDVSSGVETKRRKDPEKIRQFIAAARRAATPVK